MHARAAARAAAHARQLGSRHGSRWRGTRAARRCVGVGEWWGTLWVVIMSAVRNPYEPLEQSVDATEQRGEKEEEEEEDRGVWSPEPRIPYDLSADGSVVLQEPLQIGRSRMQSIVPLGMATRTWSANSWDREIPSFYTDAEGWMAQSPRDRARARYQLEVGRDKLHRDDYEHTKRPPEWFQPKTADVKTFWSQHGFLISQFQASYVRYLVFGTMALGGALFISLFVLSAWCNAEGEDSALARTGADATALRPRTYIVAGVGLALFWVAIIHFGYAVTCTPVLHWDTDSREDQDEWHARQLVVVIEDTSDRSESEEEEWLKALLTQFGGVVEVCVCGKERTGKTQSVALVLMENAEAANQVVEERLPASMSRLSMVCRFAVESQRSGGSMDYLRWCLREKCNSRLGNLQRIAVNHTISDKTFASLQFWRRTCYMLRYCALALACWAAFGCVEVLVRDADRSDLDQFWWAGGDLVLLVPECISRPRVNQLLMLIATFYSVGLIFAGFIVEWLMLGVGMGAYLARDKTRKVMAKLQSKNFPLISPIRTIDTQTGMLVPDERDRADIDVLSSDNWRQDAVRASKMWEILCDARMRDHSSGGFEVLRQNAEELLEHGSEQEQIMLQDIRRICSGQRATLGDAAEDEVMKAIGYKLINSPSALVSDDVAWEIEVRRPAVHIARRTLAHLEGFEVCIGTLFSAAAALLLLIPYAVVTQNILVCWIVTFAAVPLLVVYPVAHLGTACDELLNALNDLRTVGLNMTDGYKVESLRSYLRERCEGQGLGMSRVACLHNHNYTSILRTSAPACVVIALQLYHQDFGTPDESCANSLRLQALCCLEWWLTSESSKGSVGLLRQY
eukprot:COSAG02_NODE_244_length_27402_cov_41.050397_4_plen_853_part_00